MLVSVAESKQQVLNLPDEVGVYAIYDNAETLQYVGISRKVRGQGLTRGAT